MKKETLEAMRDAENKENVVKFNSSGDALNSICILTKGQEIEKKNLEDELGFSISAETFLRWFNGEISKKLLMNLKLDLKFVKLMENE